MRSPRSFGWHMGSAIGVPLARLTAALKLG